MADAATSEPVLRVMQWNILADGLAQFGDFVRVPKEVLEWNSRAPKLLNKIVEADADIVCLQELNHYDDYFAPQLRQHGYSGKFQPKSYSPAEKYGSPPDGCGIFFRASKLQLLEHEIQTKNGLMIRLKDRQTNQELIVVTIHLKAKTGKENEAIRLKQVQQLVKELVINTREGITSSIICGDFNTNPHSVVYEIMHKHSIGFQSVFACIPEIRSEENETSSIIPLGRSSDGGAIAEPPFTTWKFRSTGERQETIDYIWFSKHKGLVPHRLWRLPTLMSIGVDALPSESMPSDHLPLLCEFLWKQEEGT